MARSCTSSWCTAITGCVEPTPPDNPLLGFDNVLITPHMASFAQEATERSRGFAIYNADRVAKGQEPESAVPPDGLA